MKYRRDGNRYRYVRRTPSGLTAIRQRRLYDYGFQPGDDYFHGIEWLKRVLRGGVVR